MLKHLFQDNKLYTDNIMAQVTDLNKTPTVDIGPNMSVDEGVRRLVYIANQLPNFIDAGTSTSTASIDSKISTPAVLADATSNPNITKVSAFEFVFNGTTWDRLRSAVIAVSSTLTGFVNSLPWAIYNAVPTVRTEAQGGPLQADVNGNLLSSMGTKVAGEDLTNDVLKVENQMTYLNITTATTTTVKTGTGLFNAITINKNVATATITIYDNTAASGTKIGTITAGAALLSDPPLNAIYNVKFATGLTIVTSGATDITICYR